ncbi:MAG: hypothetical protein D6714_05240, partial [Bacteroidetes bacterium]
MLAGLGAQNAPSRSALTREKPPLSVGFYPEGGFFHQAIQVELTAPGARIYFTTDGTTPKPHYSMKYGGPITVTKTTVVRAIAVRGGETSVVFGHTYFIDEPETTIPVVSVSITPGLLFDPDYGLFVKGPNAIDSLWKLPGANFWSRNEVPVNAEIFETDGACVYRSQSGFRLFGGMSRLFPQKSFTLVARKRYGQKRIKHEVFGKKGLKKFKFLVLRNSGSDYAKAHFRDAFMTTLIEDWNVDKQDFRPAHVYINGTYWGLYNIREKVNRYFIGDHHKEVDKDSIDLLEHYLVRKRGSRRAYKAFLNYLETHSLDNATNYAQVCSMMDVDNFMDYQIAQIYFDNRDAGGNIKYWRPQRPDGKWRWILYDTDWGFGLHDDQAWKYNTLEFHTKPDGPNWPNPPWSTFILRKLLENRAFRQAFVNRFADRLNTSLSPEAVTETLDRFYRLYAPEMPRHLARWRLSRSKWEEQVAIMREFGQKRPAYMRQFLRAKFDTGAERKLEIETTHGGYVRLNQNLRVEGHFEGTYFQNMPVEVEAVPALGYRFAGWEGIFTGNNASRLVLALHRKTYRLKAVFEKFEDPLAGQI